MQLVAGARTLVTAHGWLLLVTQGLILVLAVTSLLAAQLILSLSPCHLVPLPQLFAAASIYDIAAGKAPL